MQKFVVTYLLPHKEHTVNNLSLSYLYWKPDFNTNLKIKNHNEATIDDNISITALISNTFTTISYSLRDSNGRIKDLPNLNFPGHTIARQTRPSDHSPIHLITDYLRSIQLVTDFVHPQYHLIEIEYV